MGLSCRASCEVAREPSLLYTDFLDFSGLTTQLAHPRAICHDELVIFCSANSSPSVIHYPPYWSAKNSDQQLQTQRKKYTYKYTARTSTTMYTF